MASSAIWHLKIFKEISLGFKCYLREFQFLIYEHYKGIQNPQWLLMRKLGRFEVVRSAIRLCSNKEKPYQPSLSELSLFKNIDADQVVEALSYDGIYLGLRLPPETAQAILEFAMRSVCYGNRKREISFFYSQKKYAEALYRTAFTVGGYYNTSLNCPEIDRLANDPKLIEIATKYLRAKPKLLGSQLWWSFAVESSACEKRKAFQTFHYDLDDYRFLKFFFYLTEVDLLSGPHTCIQGSHRKKRFLYRLLNKQYSEQELLSYYGADKVITICGEAGFGFVEDTFCFHKGTPPLSQDRLILQLEFAANDYGMQSDSCSF